MWNQELYIKAMSFAAEVHGDQKVPGKEIPYLFHITLVAGEATRVLFEEGVDDPDLLVQCAILHDTVEDTETSPEIIEEIFGAHVARGVAALSKDNSYSKAEAMRESIERIKAEPREIWMVKMADRITNLRPPPAHWTPLRCEEYHREALYIHRSLKEASPFLAARLMEKISSYEKYCS